MEWNKRNVRVAVAILVLGCGGGGIMFLHQVGVTQGGPEFMWFRVSQWVDGLDGKMTPMSPSEEREAKKKTERIGEMVLEKYPALRIEEDEVPRERNGFYAMLKLAEDRRVEELSNSDVSTFLSEDKFDPDQLREKLKSFEEVGLEIERVAGMPERSSSDAPEIFAELTWAGAIKTMHDYLVLQARLAAVKRDEAEAFRYLSLAENLSDHLRLIEAPTMLSETVVLLNSQARSAEIFTQVLPRLGQAADLEKWSRLLGQGGNAPQRYANVLRGEFAFFIEQFGFLGFDEVPDPEAVIFAHAARTAETVNELGRMDFTEFMKFNGLPIQQFTEGLSLESVSLLEMLEMVGSWNVGFVRNYVGKQHRAAAMDLLIREKAGEDLSVLTETYVLNPKTGKLFGYDASTRTLEEVTESGGGPVEAFKLPW